MKKQALMALLLAGLSASAQSTYMIVYNLFQTHCTAGCHSGSAPDAQLDLAGAPADVYNALVNKSPVNAAALGKGDKLIMPGYPKRSFLLRKCDNALDTDNALDVQEGELMPSATSPLEKKDIELIRQWILHGAPQSGSPVDTSVINKYYRGKAITSPAAPLPKPTVAGAFQVHVGKLFVAPSSEFQFYLKQDLNLQDTIEVYRIDAMLGDRGHHFNMLKFNPGTASSFAEGLRDLLGTSHLSASVIGAFQHSYNLELPPGTAYQWEAGMVLDINFHIINPNSDSVLAVDLYINVYSQPKGTATDIMRIKWYSNFTFAIPWDNTNHEFTATGFEINEPELWDVWMMSSHTHKYGTDFDVYLRNSDGSQGAQVYEGFFSPEYAFNQGYYDWQHPPRRYFDPFLTVDPNNGFIYKATYKNTGGPALIFWGATAADEMMIMYIHYIHKRETTAAAEIQGESRNLTIFPNPATAQCSIRYALSENSTVDIELFNSSGQKHATVCTGELQTKGEQSRLISFSASPGIYFIKLAVNGKVQAKPFIIAD